MIHIAGKIIRKTKLSFSDFGKVRPRIHAQAICTTIATYTKHAKGNAINTTSIATPIEDRSKTAAISASNTDTNAAPIMSFFPFKRKKTVQNIKGNYRARSDFWKHLKATKTSHEGTYKEQEHYAMKDIRIFERTNNHSIFRPVVSIGSCNQNLVHPHLEMQPIPAHILPSFPVR